MTTVSEVTAEEVKNLLSDYYGYTGTFKVDAKQKIITHYPIIHSLPNSVGKPLQRSYRFEGKKRLYLTTIGDKQESVFTWERVGD
jgi:hypothetical protein